jgi:hypothetical protein
VECESTWGQKVLELQSKVHLRVQGFGTRGESQCGGQKVVELLLGIRVGVQGPSTKSKNSHEGQSDNLGYKVLLKLVIDLVSTKVGVGVCTRVMSLHKSPKAHTR